MNMKNYTNNMSEEKIKLLCQILSAASFKRFFQENPKVFSKIRPGFRPNSLKNGEVIALVAKNIDDSLLNNFVNDHTQKILEKIESAIEQMPDKDRITAIADALQKSPFNEQPDLYFDLQYLRYSDEEIAKIKECMLQLQENDIADEPDTVTEKTETESAYAEKLQRKLQFAEDQIERNKAEYLQKVDSLNAEKQNVEMELAELKKRVQYADEEDTFEIPTDYEYMSLCEATEEDSQGNSWYYRRADIKSDGTIAEFFFDEEQPWYFENRNRILIKDGLLEEGKVGIWGWSSSIRDTDPSKDYVVSRYYPNLVPTEVILLHDCSNIEELIKKLKEGININSTSNKMLLCYLNADGDYTGLLCTNSSFDSTAFGQRLKSEIVELPQYCIKRRNTVRLFNSTQYINNLHLGVPEKIKFVKDPFDVVRTIISNRNSWATFKQKGKTRSEWKNVKEFLEQMDTIPLIQELAGALHCSEIEAEETLEKFIEEAETYIDGQSIEDQVLLATLAVNPELMTRCKTLVREDWEKENQSVLEEAHQQLEIVQRKKSSVDLDLKSEQGKVEKLKASLAQIELEIEDKKKLASDVELEVQNRIEEAQKNAAKFIAEMAFAPQSNPLTTVANKETSTRGNSRYMAGVKIPQIKLEEDIDWKGELDTIEDNLIEAGVAVVYARQLATYLYSAYLSPAHVSVMLIGPNAEDITDAFSCAILGKTANVLDCEGDYDHESVVRSQSGESKIVKIKNPFENHWISRLSSMVNTSDVFYMAVYPFPEDVQIEPKSVFNYFLPICTELFVDRTATGKYVAGNKTDEFIEYPVKTAFKRSSKFNSLLHMPQITGNRIQSVIDNQHIMLEVDEKNIDSDILFAYLPYAYTTMQLPVVLELLEDTEGDRNNISSELRRAVMSLYGQSE